MEGECDYKTSKTSADANFLSNCLKPDKIKHNQELSVLQARMALKWENIK